MKTLPLLPVLLFPLLATLPLLRTIGGLGPMPPAAESPAVKESKSDRRRAERASVFPQGADENSVEKEKPRAVRRGA